MVVFLGVEFCYESLKRISRCIDIFKMKISRSGSSNVVISGGSDFAGDGI